MHDDICLQCKNRLIKYKDQILECPFPCAPITWINGNKPLREPLIEDLRLHGELVDYNIALSELIEDHHQRIDYIMDIPDIRLRAIAAMLAVKIKKKDIAKLISMSLRQIIRITHK